jgi:hypothetical protein
MVCPLPAEGVLTVLDWHHGHRLPKAKVLQHNLDGEGPHNVQSPSIQPKLITDRVSLDDAWPDELKHRRSNGRHGQAIDPRILPKQQPITRPDSDDH